MTSQAHYFGKTSNRNEPKQFKEEQNELVKNEIINNVKQSEIDFIFDPVSQNSYHKEGDPRMYTNFALDQREDLKNDETVKDAIEDFCQSLFTMNIDKEVSKENYSESMKRIAKLLRSDLQQDSTELNYLIMKDWEMDSKGTEMLSQENLFNAMFELVDIWTPNISAEVYVNFFNVLKEKLHLAPNKKNFKLNHFMDLYPQ